MMRRRGYPDVTRPRLMFTTNSYQKVDQMIAETTSSFRGSPWRDMKLHIMPMKGHLWAGYLKTAAHRVERLPRGSHWIWYRC